MKKETFKENEIIEFPNQKIVDIPMDREVKKSFIDYSMSVITSRAIPDVRDGMKPGQRRVLYAMFEDHLTHDKPFRKSATTVGNVLGRYHPHGDSSVYGTMVRMAQPFSLRYPLVEGHGNFGSVDGDPPAAYRYTEARLARIADTMMADIDKEVVEFVPNFDNKLREPTVLPSRIPNFLVNGSVGIAVGMATNVPPHNLREVADAVFYRMDNPQSGVGELMQFIKGPDFPTGAEIYGTAGIVETYATGKGRIVVRSVCDVQEEKHRIIVTEIPYGVNKSMLCDAMRSLARDKKIDGITEVRDESGRHGMRIVIEYRRDANGQLILNQLYKYTELQSTFAANMLGLVKGEPKVLNLMQVLDNYISHQEDVILRRTRYELEKALSRAHILEGYVIAIENIDEVVNIMKTSPSIPESKAKLMERFGLSDAQSQAIVDMTLGRLTGLETQKIEDELSKLREIIEKLRAVLDDETMGKVKQIIKDELSEIVAKYGDERMTKIVEAEDEIMPEDLIEKEHCVVTISHGGYIKRVPADTYQSQRRGGRGITAVTAKEEDFIENVLVVFSHSYLMMFTNTGKVYTRKAYTIPEASRNAKGTNIVNLLELAEGEKLTAVLDIGTDTGIDRYLTMVTRNGIIKRTPLSEYEYQRKTGKKALNLDEGDELIFVTLTKGENDIVIATHEGRAVRFSESDVREMGRAARGVRGIKIRGNDFVVSAAVVKEGCDLLTVTEGGYGKRTPFDDFRLMKNRGGSGVTAHNITEKTGLLCNICAVSDDDDIMLITNTGVMIRMSVSDIPRYSRTAAGVIVMRLGDGQFIVNMASLAKEKEEVPEAEEASETEEIKAADSEAEVEAETEE